MSASDVVKRHSLISRLLLDISFSFPFFQKGGFTVNKLKNLSPEKRSAFKKIGCLFCALCVFAFSAVSAFAEGAGTAGAPAVSAVQSVFNDVTGTINIGNVVSILAIVVGACVGLVLMWFGIRKVIRIIMGAFRKGKISV